MKDALEEIERWCRKYYKFEFGCGPNIQPGDGPWVKLSAGGREVFVDEYDMPHDPDEHPTPTFGEVILEALRRWHADDSVKFYRVYWSVKPEFPEYTPIEGVKSQWWTKDMTMMLAYISATNEEKAKEKALAGYPENLRSEIKLHVYETKH